jgi:hypothetical protein
MQLTCRRTPFLLERMEAFRIAREARVVRTFQNVRLFAGMSVLENLLVAQHAALSACLRFSALLALPSYGKAARKAWSGALLARQDRPDTGGQRHGRRSSLWLAAQARDRNAQCARTRGCSAWMSPRRT